MKKRFLALLLAGCLLIILGACQTEQDEIYSQAVAEQQSVVSVQPTADPDDPDYLGDPTPLPGTAYTPAPNDDLQGELVIKSYMQMTNYSDRLDLLLEEFTRLHPGVEIHVDYPWTVGVKFDPTAREVQQVDPRWGCDVAVGLFQSQVLDKLAEEEPFFHARTNSLAVAMAASQVLQAGGVDHLPVKSQKLWVPDGNKAFQSWEKPVVRLLHSRGKWEALLEEFSRQSYWPVLLSDQVETDWSKMAARVRCLGEAAALLPQLAETAILFLEVPEGNPTVWDYQLDLAQMEPKEACREVLGFFGEEE